MPGGTEQVAGDFIMLLRKTHNLKLTNRLFLKFPLCFQIAVDN